MHRLLVRQLKRHYGADLQLQDSDDGLGKLFNAVSQAYEHYDKELRLTERANDVNLEELNSTYELLKARNAEILELATQDSLTGLPNRRQFLERLEHNIQCEERKLKPFSIIFLDLDRFKMINDTLGHHVGDALLVAVAGRLQKAVRTCDTVARLGGDEFTLLLEDLEGGDSVSTVADKLIAQFQRPYLLEGREFIVTCSLGIAHYPSDASDSATLLSYADTAMYAAKKSGRNNYQLYRHELTDSLAEAVALESRLRGALERDEFVLHYQPQVDINTGRIVGIEALIRWQDLTLGLVQPDVFIPIAEDTGIIDAIGEWVLHTACRQAAAWLQAGLTPVVIAVNVSGRQLAHEGLLQSVDQALADTGLDPAWLELELTETEVMNNVHRSDKMLTGLHQRGVRLSIDDFGTGYSSLSRLKQFPIDRLKIGRSFIRDIPGNADDAAITRAIIAMGHTLKLDIIAEGVENEAQLQYLAHEGCDVIQGVLIADPMREEQMTALLQEQQPAANDHAA